MCNSMSHKRFREVSNRHCSYISEMSLIKYKNYVYILNYYLVVVTMLHNIIIDVILFNIIINMKPIIITTTRKNYRGC